MGKQPLPIAAGMILTMLMLTGCDRDTRLAEQAERHSQRQAEQNRSMARLQQQVAEGSRRLVEADAKARGEFTVLQREIQTQRNEVGKQRDVLEVERREIATQRHLDPIIAAAITNTGWLLACAMPLIICWQLLRHPVDPADESAVSELLLQDMVSETPLLLPMPSYRNITHYQDAGARSPSYDDTSTEIPEHQTPGTTGGS